LKVVIDLSFILI